MHRGKAVFLPAVGCLLLWMLAGCTSPSTSAGQAAETRSAWGPILTLGEAEYAAAPTIALSDDGAAFAWVGADASGVHQDGRVWAAGQLDETVVLPLPPRNPFALQTFAAGPDRLHHLWLDQNGTRELRLYSALLSLPLAVERGPIEITEQATRRYTASRTAEGGLWVVAAGGLDYAPALYAHRLDEAGRPRLENVYQIASEADYPALTQTSDGSLLLFWLGTADNRVYRGVLLPNGQLDAVAGLGNAPALDSADRLESFRVALDLTHTYLFWNVITADGVPQSWYTSAPHTATAWPAPQPVSITVQEASIQTGFNAGGVQAVEPGTVALGYIVPAGGVFPMVPTAAYDPAGILGVLFWQAGRPVGYSRVLATQLIGPPALAVDRALYLYMSGSAPNAAGAADLWVTSLRFSAP
jgi:hypothetical protein